MRRIGIIGLCLAAAVALGALAASSAVAGEYGDCARATKVDKKYLGHYANKECTKHATTAEEEAGKTNKYEWVSAAGTKYTDTTKTASWSSAGGGMTCASSTSSGEITGWMTGTDQILLKRCELNIIGPMCSSAGKGEEEIETFPLKTYLLDHGSKGASGLEPKEGEVWTEVLAEPGNPKGIGAENSDEPLDVEFLCTPGVLFEMSGTLSAVTTPVNKMDDKFTDVFGAGKGEQDLKTTAFEPGEVNTGPNIETTTATLKYGAKTRIEIRACNEAGAVSEGKGVLACEHEESP